MEKYKIETINNGKRMSTQQLLQLIHAKIDAGITDFEIDACGQHNIGGSVWAKDNKKTLRFLLRNPGQRVGAMGMKGTQIVVEGAVPADTGWLNSGAEIVVKGDSGDTTAHCAASGEIYIGGRVGARSGALMKHDPKSPQPEFWILKNTGSFSFEFMGGGLAIVCGYDCDGLNSVLGKRACVGMVGGIVYVRGALDDVADCVEVLPLDNSDIAFLTSGLKRFLAKIERPELERELNDWRQWHKIKPLGQKLLKDKVSLKDFRENEWIAGGLFGEFISDDYVVNGLVGVGDARCRIPQWDEVLCVGCGLCANNCPQKAISKTANSLISDDNKCIGCGICAAVCPKKAWTMFDNNKEIGLDR